ncbi:hypothetical protein [Natrinema salifodinae]|uniref:Uncharacterized protein n=1 Tax=Natrinema salifodinae TaxID=1202768 RepID=A0A1I0QG37_9EURY|nr:hypothetical protein [Natrinema salifodinae]SEW25928.1 hypothetical protein SAMN05216285_3516 [Natrinema salifodinae]
MAHTKSGRTKKAHDAERRQRERELAEALERRDEPEPDQLRTEAVDADAGDLVDVETNGELEADADE